MTPTEGPSFPLWYVGTFFLFTQPPLVLIHPSSCTDSHQSICWLPPVLFCSDQFLTVKQVSHQSLPGFTQASPRMERRWTPLRWFPRGWVMILETLSVFGTFLKHTFSVHTQKAFLYLWSLIFLLLSWTCPHWYQTWKLGFKPPSLLGFALVSRLLKVLFLPFMCVCPSSPNYFP